MIFHFSLNIIQDFTQVLYQVQLLRFSQCMMLHILFMDFKGAL